MRVSAGEVVYPPGGRLGPRWQHDVELVLVHSGSARVRVDDDPPALLGPESVGLLLPGHRERFEFDDREETHHSWIQLGLAGSLPELIATAPRTLPASTAVAALMREAISARGAGKGGPAARPVAECLAVSLATAAIWRYVADAELGIEGAGGPVDRACRHLDTRLADPDLNLERLAAAAHVTPAHLVRCFGTELGTTPMAYLWRRRVAAGVDLLTDTGLPVGEVARRAGFRSVYHFSRRVKQASGLSPTELRRRRWSRVERRGESQSAPPSE